MRIRNVRIDNYLGGDRRAYVVGLDGRVARADVVRTPHNESARAVIDPVNDTASTSYTLRGFFQVRSRAAGGQRLVHWAAALLGAMHWYV